jgi:hypothetical protein
VFLFFSPHFLLLYIFFGRKAKINMGRLWSGAHVENMGCKELFRAFQVHPGGREMAYTWMSVMDLRTSPGGLPTPALECSQQLPPPCRSAHRGCYSTSPSAQHDCYSASLLRAPISCRTLLAPRCAHLWLPLLAHRLLPCRMRLPLPPVPGPGAGAARSARRARRSPGRAKPSAGGAG